MDDELAFLAAGGAQRFAYLGNFDVEASAGALRGKFVLFRPEHFSQVFAAQRFSSVVVHQVGKYLFGLFGQHHGFAKQTRGECAEEIDFQSDRKSVV